MYIYLEVFVKINAKEARSKFSSLLDKVKEGDEVIIMRRHKQVARLVSPRKEEKSLPDLKAFRKSIRLKGEPLSSIIIKERQEERY